MMVGVASAELTIQERGILAATSASAAYLDSFSSSDRLLVSTFQQAVLRPRERKYYSRGQTWVAGWQDYGAPLPAWFDPFMQGFVDLLTLQPNWDSYGARAIDRKLVHYAMNLTHGLLRPTSPAPRIVPLSSGGLQLEWSRYGTDLEIVFEPDCEPFFYHRSRLTGEEVEHPL